MNDVRYVLEISSDHQNVRLTDRVTGELHYAYTGPRALYDALGVLADWREADRADQTHMRSEPGQ